MAFKLRHDTLFRQGIANPQRAADQLNAARLKLRRYMQPVSRHFLISCFSCASPRAFPAANTQARARSIVFLQVRFEFHIKKKPALSAHIGGRLIGRRRSHWRVPACDPASVFAAWLLRRGHDVTRPDRGAKRLLRCGPAPWFLSMADARDRIELWRREYNDGKTPHGPRRLDAKGLCEIRLPMPGNWHSSRTTNGGRTGLRRVAPGKSPRSLIVLISCSPPNEADGTDPTSSSPERASPRGRSLVANETRSHHGGAFT